MLMRNQICGVLVVVSVMVVTLSTPAQSELDALPRRGYFGVGLEQAENGVRAFAVTPGSTAAAAGVLVGDVIAAIDGRPAGSPEAAVAAIGRHKSGESVTIDLLRGGERHMIEVTLKPYPLEEMANASVHYGSVTALPGVRLRTILSVPTGQPDQRFPAVMLVQGGGCGSVDSPFNVTVAQPGLMHAIGSQGFVTMRVEKSGVGDSEGPACASIGYVEELSGYRAALTALRAHPSVDPQRVYLVGISLGGVFAPILAAETKVAGISVYGTLAVPPPPYPGRSERFFKEFAAVNLAEAWAKTATRVQVLHGEYDIDAYVSSEGHQQIAAIVNGSGTGSALYRELPGLDHCWTRHPSLEASKDRCGQGEPTTVLADTILAFLRAR
jgi:dienelactone hydrolase